MIIFSCVLVVCITLIISLLLNRKCNHDYKHLKKITLYPNGNEHKMPSGYKYLSQCTKCCDIKERTV